MLLNLQLIFFFVYFIIKNFKKVLRYYTAIGNIIVYYMTIISNILNKMIDYIKLKIVKNWLI